MAAYQGTLATIRDAVIKTLRLDETLDVDRVDEWINLAYQQAVQQTGCNQRKGTAAMTSGVDSYDLPEQVAWLILLVIQYADGSTSKPLQQVTLEQLLESRWTSTAAGTEVVRPVYTLVGENQLEIWPGPATGQTLQFWFACLPDALVEDADEPEIMEPYATKLLQYGALVEGARFKKDPLLSDFESAYEVWLSSFQVWLNRRQGASPRRFRVRGTSVVPAFSHPSTDISW